MGVRGRGISEFMTNLVYKVSQDSLGHAEKPCLGRKNRRRRERRRREKRKRRKKEKEKKSYI